MRDRVARVACTVLLAASVSTLAGPIAVRVDNHTRLTTCAEEDNVSLSLTGSAVSRFTVEALQPGYLAAVQSDITAPDFSGCNFDGSAHPTDPRFHFTPRTQVLLDSAQWRIFGLTLQTFWRSQRVPVTVGGRTVRGVHLLQVFRKVDGKALEAVVLYPSDGYWRIKPLPAPGFGDGLYGASFLIGPIAQGQRPAVNIASVTVATRPRLSLRLAFAHGGSARIDVPEISTTRTALEVKLQPGAPKTRPFAVLRSMYVAPDNADTSEVAWKAAPDAIFRTAPLPAVTSLTATDVRFGRSTPSRHNTSAPDIRFSDFR